MLDIKTMRANLKTELREAICGNSGEKYLKIIQVEGDIASNSYTRGKKKDCEEIGLKCVHDLLPNSSDVSDVWMSIARGNNDENCIGIILQLPLPPHLMEYTNGLTCMIDKEKDVDGFRVDSPFDPCTPAGIVYIMKKHFENKLAGKTALIIGRGKLVGKPLAKLLDKENMTIMQANSYTPPGKLQQLCATADVIITATGRANTITEAMACFIPDSTLIIDAGINRDENGKMCGDCDPKIYDIHNNITPVPGGVGLMTRAMLLSNCIQAMED